MAGKHNRVIRAYYSEHNRHYLIIEVRGEDGAVRRYGYTSLDDARELVMRLQAKGYRVDEEAKRILGLDKPRLL